MASDNADLTIRINADGTNATAAFDAIQRAADETKDNLGDLSKGSLIAFAALTAGIVLTTQAAAEAEIASLDLSLSLQTIGQDTPETVAALNGIAESLSKISPFNVDEIKESMATLNRFTKDAAITQEYESAVVALATVRHMDLNTATRAVGMAFEGNTALLKRQGVILSDNVSGVEALQEIYSQYANAQAQEAETLTGKENGLKNAWHDLSVEIGEHFLPVAKEIVDTTKNIVNGIMTFDKENNGLLADLLGTATAIGGVVAGFTFLGPKVLEAVTAFKSFYMVLVANPIIAAAAAVAALGAAIAFVGTAWVNATNKEIEERTSTKNMIETTKELIAADNEKLALLKEGTNEYQKVAAELQKRQALLKGLTALEKEHTAAVQESNTTVKASEPVYMAVSELSQKVTDVLKKNDIDIVELEKEKYKEIYDAEIASGKDKLTAAQNAVTKYNEWVAKENKGELDSLEKQADAVLKIEQAKDKQWLADKEKFGELYANLNEFMNSSEVKSTEKGFQDLTSLSSSQNEALFDIGKAASMAMIPIQTAQSAMNIYSSFSSIPVVGVALGIAGAAAAIAYGGERLAEVAAQSFKPATAAAGIYPVSGMSEPLITTLDYGEAIIPKSMTSAITSGEMSLSKAGAGGSGGAVHIHIHGDNIGIDSNDLVNKLTVKIRAMIQSKQLNAARFTGAA